MAGDETAAGWDPDRYEGDHAFVYEYGADVLGWLSASPGERVLDLGCGTGQLTAAIASTGAEAVGLDRSREMLSTARAEHPDLSFVQADAHQFGFAEPCDAVFTNAAVHWLDAPEDAFEAVARALRSGGRFVGEFGGRGNVSAIVGAVAAELESRGYESQNPWYFPTIGEFATALEPQGFELRRAALFDRPVELDGGDGGLESWLAMFGGSLLAPVDDDEWTAVVSAVEDRLRPEHFRDGGWEADYRRLRFQAVRE
jgi:SAM-dependent methyltransferase